MQQCKNTSMHASAPRSSIAARTPRLLLLPAGPPSGVPAALLLVRPAVAVVELRLQAALAVRGAAPAAVMWLALLRGTAGVAHGQLQLRQLAQQPAPQAVAGSLVLLPQEAGLRRRARRWAVMPPKLHLQTPSPSQPPCIASDTM